MKVHVAAFNARSDESPIAWWLAGAGD